MDMTVNNSSAYTAASQTTNTSASTAAQTTTAANAASATSTSSSASTASNASNNSAKSDVAAVYEKSSKQVSKNTIYSKNAIVKKLKADQQNRIDSMQSLVENLLGKQKGTFDLSKATGLASTFRQAAALASPEDIAQAQKDVADDGYWGVKQTSDRLVSMAIALTGGDTSKADQMKDAIEKGFKKATAAWGEKLPQISQDTFDAAMKKMDDWKNGVTTAEDYSNYLS